MNNRTLDFQTKERMKPTRIKPGGLESFFQVTVFEDLPERRKHNSGLPHHPLNAHFLEDLTRLAKASQVNLHGRTHNFPHPVEELENSELYDADFAICFYKSINDAGPELAHTLMRTRKQYQHIFVVAHQISNDFPTEGLTTIVRNTYKGIRLIDQPYPERPMAGIELDIDETFDAKKAGLVSFWHINAIRNYDVRNAILTKLVA